MAEVARLYDHDGGPRVSRQSGNAFLQRQEEYGEMIRMMDILIDEYADRRKLYLSWDAASWHMSKQLFARIDAHSAAVVNGGGSLVETAPLPAGAQFLNVIESVFSGMARAIIHNSDYRSVDEAKQQSIGTSPSETRFFGSTPDAQVKESGRKGVNLLSFPTRI